MPKSPDSEPPFDPQRLLEEAQRGVNEEAEAMREAAAETRQGDSERMRRLNTLLRMTAKLNTLEAVDEVLEQILACTLEITRGDRAFVLQREENRLRPWASRTREDTDSDPEGYQRISHTILDEVITQGRTHFASDALQDPNFMHRRSVQDLSLRTVACVPLRGRAGILGALYADGKGAAAVLTEDEIDLLKTFAEQAAGVLERAIHQEHLKEEAENLEKQNLSLRAALEGHSQFDQIRGQSAAMRQVFSILERVAHNPVTVLITGETGTGKELVARALHFNGSRKQHQFVAVNCAAFADSLLESQLFGFKKGSFTGADRDHPGLVEAADKGTLFLDEIAEMSLDLQSKLLRVIEEREVRRLGENASRSVDVRFVAATHRNLEQAVAEGRFREDLYYRINVVTVDLPPLRERREDIELLAEHFLETQKDRLDRPQLRFSREARRALMEYNWPGNVRELRNRVERACALTMEPLLGPEDLGLGTSSEPATEPGSAEGPASEGNLKETLLQAEKLRIEAALRRCGGVVTQAAKELEVTRQHLHTRIKRLGIDTAAFKS